MLQTISSTGTLISYLTSNSHAFTSDMISAENYYLKKSNILIYASSVTYKGFTKHPWFKIWRMSFSITKTPTTLRNRIRLSVYSEMTNIRRTSCICPIHRNQVLRQEWRCSWISAHRRCSNYEWSSGVLAIKCTLYYMLDNMYFLFAWDINAKQLHDFYY